MGFFSGIFLRWGGGGGEEVLPRNLPEMGLDLFSHCVQLCLLHIYVFVTPKFFWSFFFLFRTSSLMRLFGFKLVYVLPCFRRVFRKGSLRTGSCFLIFEFLNSREEILGLSLWSFRNVLLLCVFPPGVFSVLSQEAHTKASAFTDQYIELDISSGGDKIPRCVFICADSHLCVPVV